MATKVKLIADNAITTTQIDTSSLNSHFSGGTGVTYSSGEISIGQAVHSTDSPTFADLTLTGNLNITGDLNSYNVTDLDVTDQTITLGAGQTEALSGGSGIIVDGSGASILWDETNTEWDFNNSINVTGTVTADGLTVEGDLKPEFNFSESTAYDSTNVNPNNYLQIYNTDSTLNSFAAIRFRNGSTGAGVTMINSIRTGTESSALTFNTRHSGTFAERLRIVSNGDISFYEDTGTTAKLFWDASSESLSIGTTGSTTDRRFQVSETGPSTATTQYGIVANPTYPTNVTANVYNLYTGPNLTAGTTLTNLYNIYLEANGYPSSTVTNSFGIYQSGANDKNYFAGNVGIGASSPSAKLEVRPTNNVNLLVGNTGSELQLTSGTNGGTYGITANHRAGTHKFLTDGGSGTFTERMQINGSQTEVSMLRANNWVGGSLNTVGGPAMEIGYAGSLAYVHGYNRNASQYVEVAYDGLAHRWYTSGGANPDAVLNSNGQFLINFSNPASTSNFLLGVDGSIGLGGDDLIASGAGYGPSNSSAGAGTIKLYDTGTGNMNFNQTYTHARYYFYHGGNEVFRIEDGGHSGIYGYSYFYTTTHGSVGVGALNSGYHHTMTASGPSTFYWNNRCEASGGFHTYSDERLKENITNISGALDKVALMNGVTFNWIDADNRGSGDTGKQFGVIAQNMLTVDPELPSLNPDPLATQEEIDDDELDTDYYTMDYSRITPFLIEAVKELKTKLEAAEARITELEG